MTTKLKFFDLGVLCHHGHLLFLYPDGKEFLYDIDSNMSYKGSMIDELYQKDHKYLNIILFQSRVVGVFCSDEVAELKGYEGKGY